MKSAKAAVELLADPASMVSCHYVIDEAGVVIQMVPESLRAWHAGKSHWGGIDDINSASIGIEIHNAGHDGGLPAFPVKQMRSVEALSRIFVRATASRPTACWLIRTLRRGARSIPASGSTGRASARRRGALGAAGAGAGAGRRARARCGGIDGSEMQDMLRCYGYGVEPTGEHDRQTELAVSAFQRHFRQRRVDGRIDRSSLETLEKLIAALPSRAEA